MKTENQSGGGIGFLGLLTIVFIVLKLIGIIQWSWWYVLAPTWIPLSIALIVLIVLIIPKIISRK